MANNANNVSVGKPKTGGSAFTAPIGTVLPTDAVTALGDAFKNLGYLSESGIVNKDSSEAGSIQAWGGDNVANPQGKKTDEFKFVLIECMNIDALKVVYGDANVKGDIDAGITVSSNNVEKENKIFVFDMILKGGVVKRIVVPSGKVINVGDVTYSDSTAIGYEVTVSCEPDNAGNTHYEYLKKAAAV